MIVKMKKITLICMDADREATLNELADLGVVHLTHVVEPESDALESAREQVRTAQQASDIVRAYKADPTTPAGSITANEAIAAIHESSASRLRLNETLDQLTRERDRIEPFGEFDPAQVEYLKRKGLTVKLYKRPFKDVVEPPEGVEYFPIGSDKTTQYYALASIIDISHAAEEVALQQRSLSQVNQAIADTTAQIADVDSKLCELSAYKDNITEHRNVLEEEEEYVTARDGMGSSSILSYLQGFCPHDTEQAIQDAATKHGWGISIEEPSDEDNVPTYIRNPWVVRPIEAVLKFMGIVPGYREKDPSSAFLVFLTIFFAMIIGDGGYGLVFLALTIFAHMKFRSIPRDILRLAYTFSIATVAWGAISPNWFGLTDVPVPFPAVSEWLSVQNNSMKLSLTIGAIHLTLAHTWSTVCMLNSTKAIAQLGWIGMTWTMYILAQFLLFKTALPTWFPILGGSSFAAIALFMTPFKQIKKEWTGFVTLPLDVVGNFGDIMSYLRLFALGIAGLKVAQAFNDMGSMIGYGSAVSAVFAIIVVSLGHLLNIVLCAMSVLVHGVRLNALEFSMHMGLEWSGHNYNPFKAKLTDKNTSI